MAEFKPIESQDELDKIISDRLARANEKHAAELEKYADYQALIDEKSSLQEQIEVLNKEKSEKETTYADYDSRYSNLENEYNTLKLSNLKTQIAIENGIDVKSAHRLIGEDEESLRADAANFAESFKSKYVAPLKDTEDSEGKDEDADLKEMLKNLTERG